MTLLGLTACAAFATRHPALGPDDRRAIYTTVLGEVQRAQPMPMPLAVLDALMPATDIEADQYETVQAALGIDATMLRDFLRLQRPSPTRFSGVVPDGTLLVTVARLDSLRAASRTQAASAAAAGVAPARGAFWGQWQQAFPSTAGYVMFSPMSVMRNGSVAIVAVRVACGPVCASHELRLLERSAEGAWHTTRRVSLSES
jgi:acetyl esterase/lipase